MENEQKDQVMVKLLTRKRKLLDLREEIKLKSSTKAINEEVETDESDECHPKTKRQQVTTTENDVSSPLSCEQFSVSPPPFSPLTPILLKTKQKHENKLQEIRSPGTPYSNQPSISPPTFSPLTPLILKAKQSNYENKLQAVSHPDTPTPENVSLSCSSSIQNINYNDPASSPVHSMSPETEKLYHVLTEQELDVEDLTDTDIIENSDCSEYDDESFQEDDDDSVNDPDFMIENIVQSKVSESESESDDDHTTQNEIFETNSGDYKTNKILPLVEQRTNKEEEKINTKNKLGFIKKSDKESETPIPTKDKNKTDPSSLTSDIIVATVNEKVKRSLLPDIYIENDTTNVPLISENDQGQDDSPVRNRKTIATEITKNKGIQNFSINILMAKNIKKSDESAKSTSNNTETDKITDKNNKEDKKHEEDAVNMSKNRCKDDNAIGIKINETENQKESVRDQNSKDNEKFKSFPFMEGTNSLPDKINKKEDLEFNKTSIKEKEVSVLTKSGEDSVIQISEINFDDDVTKASIFSKNEETEDENTAQKRKEIANMTTTEYTTNKQIGNFTSENFSETEPRSRTPIINPEENTVNENVAPSNLNNTQTQKGIPENNTINKEYGSTTPTMNDINPQTSALEVNTETATDNVNADQNYEVLGPSEIRKKNKGRSRKEREQSKILRNTGKSYVTEKGKVIPDRRQKSLENCRLKCAERITEDEQKQFFESYWKLGDRDKRALFISKSVTILPKKSQKTDNRTKNRDFYCVYKFWIYNEEKPICKECFCRLLGETKGFINIVVEKKKLSPTGIIESDQRGLQPPSNKKTMDDLSSALNHISSYPSYESHYCRKSTAKKYLSADLSIAKMYRDYKNTVANPISLKLYAKCFHDLNLSFKSPSKDTCNTCDVLNAKIKISDDESRITLTAELTEHQTLAEKAYSEKRVDKDIVKNDPSVRAFAFDLQQCLPTPYLKTSVSFYKRQLWSFNLTIHDLANNEATCYMWDETIGARGANQIASCLWHFCNNLPSEVKEIIFYSDTCGGQNKNNIVAMMFMYLINSHPNLQTISHKFLVSGHTHMECDSDHAIIEKTKKRTLMKINHLNDWVQLVRTCKIQNHFKVVTMTLKDFLDFSELKSKKGPLTVKKQDDSGDKFLWQPIKWLKYTKSSIGTFQFKHDLDRNTPFKSMNFKKRGKSSTLDSFILSPISHEPLPISAEKKKDLMDLLELIDEPFRDFYLHIKTNNCQPTDPDLDEENPDLEE